MHEYGMADRLADEAQKKDLWLYDPGFKKWYTPEEFRKLFREAHAPHLGFLLGIEIRDPLEAVALGYKRVQEMQARVEAFTKLVVNYYRKYKKSV